MRSSSATLALLPFESLSGRPDDARLATGFLHDLSSEMARFPSLGVIAADSVLALQEEAGDEPALAERLGANYLLKGSLRRWGDDLRISIQLIEARTARHIWAGRFDGADLPAVHDEIAAKVSNALALRVDATLLASSRHRSPAQLETYECWLRGMECLQRGTVDSDAEGRRYFEQALKIDPLYARAHGGLSLSYFNDWSCQAWECWESNEKAAYEHAIRAESLDPDDAVVQVILARIEQYRREFDRAAARLHRAHTLAPNDANILIQLASCHTFNGDPSRGWELARRALELNPLPPPWVYCFSLVPLFVLRRYEEALELAGKAPPGLIVDVPAYKAAACAYLGDQTCAAQHLEEFREDFIQRIVTGREPLPDELLRWTLHVNPYRRDEDIAHLADGLRLAGLEGEPGRPAPAVAWPIANVFRREGAVWTLAFDHHVAQMPELRGFLDVARLLRHPGEEIHSGELAGLVVKSGGIEVLDEQARRTYRNRLQELEEEIQHASQVGAAGLAGKLEEERDALVAELRAAAGFGGRMRKTGANDERARSAVTWRIRNAIKKIENVHPRLARHLSNSIRTGAFCSYQPEHTTTWSV